MHEIHLAFRESTSQYDTLTFSERTRARREGWISKQIVPIVRVIEGWMQKSPAPNGYGQAMVFSEGSPARSCFSSASASVSVK